MLDVIALGIKIGIVISLFMTLGVWAFLVAPVVWRVL